MQDPNLDESFSETNGRSFIIKGYDKTKFNIVLTPNITLKVYIKIYTDSESLIEGLENGYKLFFGFDFKTHNMSAAEATAHRPFCTVFAEAPVSGQGLFHAAARRIDSGAFL